MSGWKLQPKRMIEEMPTDMVLPEPAQANESGSTSRSGPDSVPADLVQERQAAAALRESEARYRSLYQAVRAGIVVQDQAGRIVEANELAQEILGLSLDEMRGLTSRDPRWAAVHEDGSPFPGEDHPAVVALRTGKPVLNVPMGVTRADGERRWLLVNAVPAAETETGSSFGVVATFVDITERKATEEALRESESLLRLAQQAGHVGTFEWNVQTGTIHWTPELEALYGLPPGGFAGTLDAWAALVHPEDRHETLRELRESLAQETVEGEWRVVWPDGTEHWLAGRSWVFHDERRNPTRVVGVNIDITEHKRGEAELERLMAEVENRAAELDAIVENMAEGLIVINPSEDVVRINRAAIRMIGVSSAADVPKYHMICAKLGVRGRDGAPLPIEERGQSRALRGEEFVEQETIITSVDGVERRLFSTASPVRDDEGNVVLAVGVYRDVTRDREIEAERERLMAEAESRAAELDAVVESMAEGLIVIDQKLNIIRLNRAILQMLGFASHDEIPGSFADSERFNVRRPDGTPLPLAERGLSRALRGEPFVEQELLLAGADGLDRRVFSTASPVRDEKGDVVLAVAIYRDVSRDREIEAERERLLANERVAHEDAERHAAQMRALLASLGEAVVVVDASGRIVLRNDAARRISGRSDEHMQANIDAGDVPMFTVHGAPLPVSDWPINRARRGERFVDHEIVVAQPDGARRRIAVSGANVRGDRGPVVFGIVVFRDVTELRELERMKDDYVSLISHDLRNPLTVLTGQVSILRRLLERESLTKEAEIAAKALTSARRMNVMIEDLVETARLESGRLLLHREPTDLARLVGEIAERVGTVEDRYRLRLAAPAGMPPVPVDPNRFERAVVNLITNALKYSPAEKPVTVRVDREGDDAVVSVTDQGGGIPPEDVPRLGERFYQAKTARRVGGGLGLGLYITRLIAEAHGGRLRIESELGKGSTFSLVLPIRN